MICQRPTKNLDLGSLRDETYICLHMYSAGMLGETGVCCGPFPPRIIGIAGDVEYNTLKMEKRRNVDIVLRVKPSILYVAVYRGPNSIICRKTPSSLYCIERMWPPL